MLYPEQVAIMVAHGEIAKLGMVVYVNDKLYTIFCLLLFYRKKIPANHK